MKAFGIMASVLALAAVQSVAFAQENVAAEPVGTLSYCLPMTSLTFEVEAVKETFYAGPYAEYAKKYLGIDVRKDDSVTYTLSEVKMTQPLSAESRFTGGGCVFPQPDLVRIGVGVRCPLRSGVGVEISYGHPGGFFR